MSNCKPCHLALRKAWWHDPQSEAVRQRKHRKKLARIKEFREITNSVKNVPCMDCGIKYPPYVMDFDHRDPDQKSFTIGQSLAQVGKDRLLVEISKCDIVCSNCHRIRTHSKGGD